jgi:large subunit ribosomal protein L3
MTTPSIIGVKVGSTRIFDDQGASVPVTVVECLPNVVLQLKTTDTDGYQAIKVAAGRQVRQMNKPRQGEFKKAGATPRAVVTELDVTDEQLADLTIGDMLTVELFSDVAYVDVVGTTKGKGFAGGVKRHNFRTQDASHGNSLSHRALGSTGQCQDPGRVFKGKKMPGQMGNVQRTAQNLRVVAIDAEKNLILIKGAVPGMPGGTVKVSAALKKKAAGDKN